MPNPWLALPHHNQIGRSACTCACVRMVLEYFGCTIAEADLVTLLGTTKSGTFFDDIAKVEELGFEVKISEGKIPDLERAYSSGLPVIVPLDTMHLPTYEPKNWGAHCVVVAGATESDIHYFDPFCAKAPDVVAASVFDKAWRLRYYLMAILRPR